MQLVNSSNTHFAGAGETNVLIFFPSHIWWRWTRLGYDYRQKSSSEGRVPPCLAYQPLRVLSCICSCLSKKERYSCHCSTVPVQWWSSRLQRLALCILPRILYWSLITYTGISAPLFTQTSCEKTMLQSLAEALWSFIFFHVVTFHLSLPL